MAKIKPKKEVRVEDDLFRIFQYKKENLTEEEVSVSKEKKICLVCKGRVRKFEVYLCNCDAFYCHKCARALIDIENACWVCGEPIDESKPVKTFKREEEIDKIIVGISEGKSGARAKKFGQKLAEITDLPVEFADETLTTHDALAKMRTVAKKWKGKSDAIAAALILENYLNDKYIHDY